MKVQIHNSHQTEEYFFVLSQLQPDAFGLVEELRSRGELEAAAVIEQFNIDRALAKKFIENLGLIELPELDHDKAFVHDEGGIFIPYKKNDR